MAEEKSTNRINSSGEGSASAQPSVSEADALVARGKQLWKEGHRGAAITAYEQAAAIDPNGPGAILLEHSRQILNFFNKDLLNP